jgi:hypothetical protein
MLTRHHPALKTAALLQLFLFPEASLLFKIIGCNKESAAGISLNYF